MLLGRNTCKCDTALLLLWAELENASQSCEFTVSEMMHTTWKRIQTRTPRPSAEIWHRQAPERAVPCGFFFENCFRVNNLYRLGSSDSRWQWPHALHPVCIRRRRRKTEVQIRSDMRVTGWLQFSGAKSDYNAEICQAQKLRLMKLLCNYLISLFGFFGLLACYRQN